MRTPMLNWTALLTGVSLLTLGVVACVGPAGGRQGHSSIPPNTAGGWNIPGGCEKNLSGTYEHTTDSHYRYLAADDGRKLVLTIELASTDGGPASTEGGALIRLERTRLGFVGNTLGTGFNASRQGCPVEFPTSVKGCGDEGLLVETLMATAIDEACQADPQRASVGMEQHLLRRVQVAVAAAPTPSTPAQVPAPLAGDAGVNVTVTGDAGVTAAPR